MSALQKAPVLPVKKDNLLFNPGIFTTKTIHQCCRLRGIFRNSGNLGRSECVTQSTLDELAAMNFHGWKRTEARCEIFAGKSHRFFHSFAADQLSGEAGDGYGRFATERLETGAVDHLFAVFLLELDPHSDHIAAIRTTNRANGIGALHLAHIFRVGDGVSDFLLKILGHNYSSL